MKGFFKMVGRRFRNDQSGIATVELALIAALIMVVTIPVIDVAKALHSNLKVTTAMRSGVFYAYRKPTDTAGIEAALRAATNLDAQHLSVTNTQSCVCNSAVVACNTACATGMATYLNLSANYISPLATYYPGLGDTYTITRTSAIRIR
jgi:Flp pilus assembly protein TadG